MTRLRILFYAVSILVFLSSIVWFVIDISFEPFITLLGSIGALIGLLIEKDSADFNSLVLRIQVWLQSPYYQAFVEYILKQHKNFQDKLEASKLFISRNHYSVRVITILLIIIIFSLFVFTRMLSNQSGWGGTKPSPTLIPDWEKNSDPSTATRTSPNTNDSTTEAVVKEAIEVGNMFMNRTFVNCNGKRYVQLGWKSDFMDYEKIEFSNMTWDIRQVELTPFEKEQNEVEWVGVIYLRPESGDTFVIRWYKDGKPSEYTEQAVDDVSSAISSRIEIKIGMRKIRGKWEFWIPDSYEQLLPPSSHYEYKPLSCSEAARVFPR